MPSSDHAPARPDQQLAAALDHVDAFGVHERSGDLPRSSAANVVSRIGAAAAASVRRQQVIPAVAIYPVGSFAIDGEIARFVIRVLALARLGIEFHLPDVAEIRT